MVVRIPQQFIQNISIVGNRYHAKHLLSHPNEAKGSTKVKLG